MPARIEFDGTFANTEITVIDADGLKVDSFWCGEKVFEFGGDPLRSAMELAHDIEDFLPSPVIGGEFGHLHPYWKEREEVKARVGRPAYADRGKHPL